MKKEKYELIINDNIINISSRFNFQKPKNAYLYILTFYTKDNVEWLFDLINQKVNMSINNTILWQNFIMRNIYIINEENKVIIYGEGEE